MVETFSTRVVQQQLTQAMGLVLLNATFLYSQGFDLFASLLVSIYPSVFIVLFLAQRGGASERVNTAAHTASYALSSSILFVGWFVTLLVVEITISPLASFNLSWQDTLSGGLDTYASHLALLHFFFFQLFILETFMLNAYLLAVIVFIIA